VRPPTVIEPDDEAGDRPARIAGAPRRPGARARFDSQLLERAHELGVIDAALKRAWAGRGCCLRIEGEAGIGKSALMDVLAAQAAASGGCVLRARCSPLERNLAFGAVHQLLAGLSCSLDRPARELVLRGAAALATPFLAAATAPSATLPAPADPMHGTLHGLYWLIANLAALTPLALLVDDVHLADAASLRFLGYLGARLDGLPVLVASAARPYAEAVDPAAQLALTAALEARVLRPRRLSPQAARRLLERRLGAAVEEGFATACHQASAGNPFYLLELAREAVAQQIPPTAASASAINALKPSTLRHSIRERLAGLGATCQSLVAALAVLGGGEELALVAQLAGLALPDALNAADRLAGCGILAPGEPPTFAHPIVREIALAALPSGRRATLHRQAAELLGDRGASADRVAAQLIDAAPCDDPAGRAATVGLLREAAADAAARGAVEHALRYLRRALVEPPPAAQRAQLLFELGSLGAARGEPEALAALEQAARLADSDELRARAQLTRACALALAGRAREALGALGAARKQRCDRELARAVELDLAALLRARYDSAAAARRLLAIAANPGSRQGCAAWDPLAAGVLAWAQALDNRPADTVAALASQAPSGPGLAGLRLRLSLPAAPALIWVDDPHAATRWLRSALASARASGAIADVALIGAWLAHALLRCGDLRGALGEGQAALALAREQRLRAVEQIAGVPLALAQVEAGQASAALALTHQLDGPELEPFGWFDNVRHARARALLATGQAAAAMAELEAIGVRHRRYASCPAELAWRSDAALAALRLGRRKQARRLAGRELELARAFGAPRTLGVALRALALVAEKPAARLSLLEQAVEALACSQDLLERARTLADLGAALRRTRGPRVARAPLREALELAHSAGARPLIDHIRTELAAAGARPRRERLRGAEALTPSELRVARLARDGATNREIAQALFVTLKTVEAHLASAYRKLGIRGRAELGVALAERGTS